MSVVYGTEWSGFFGLNQLLCEYNNIYEDDVMVLWLSLPHEQDAVESH